MKRDGPDRESGKRGKTVIKRGDCGKDREKRKEVT